MNYITWRNAQILHFQRKEFVKENGEYFGIFHEYFTFNMESSKLINYFERHVLKVLWYVFVVYLFNLYAMFFPLVETWHMTMLNLWQEDIQT
jgi:hypothetical protein